jgi:uncharacterized protein YceK
MKILSLILAVLILFSGCTTVPRAEKPREVERGIYTVRISNDYARNEKAVKYAINEFVKSKKHESYDAKITKNPSFFYNYYEYTITVPGATPVEDLPKEKIFDRKATAELVTYIAGPPLTILLILGFLGWIASGF